MEDNLPRKTTFNGRQPSMEDNLQWKTNPSTPNLKEIDNSSAMLDSPAPLTNNLTLFTMGEGHAGKGAVSAGPKR